MMLRFTAIALALLSLPGCGGHDVIVNQQAPIATTATPDEIDAAMRLPLDNDKSAALAEIARRPQLSADMQVHVVDAAFDGLAFDDSRMNVLVTLVENRTFCQRAKARILDRIDELTDMNPKQEVLYAIDRRGQLLR